MFNWLKIYIRKALYIGMYSFMISIFFKLDSILFFDVCLNSTCLQVIVIVLLDTSHEHSLKVKY